MPWFKVDDSLPTHRKVLCLPRGSRRFAAIGAWTMAGAWCSANLTEGRIPKTVLADLGITPTIAADLVSCGLWVKDPAGYVMHDFLVYNPSKEQVEKDRAAAAERQRAARERAKQKRDTDKSHGGSHGVTHGVSHTGSHGPPDPTRPDPTPTTSVVTSGSDAGDRRGHQPRDPHDDPARTLLEEHQAAVGSLSAGTRRALLEHVTAALDRTEPDTVRDALRRYRDRAASGQRTLPGLLPRLVDDVVAEHAGDDPLTHPDAQAFLAAQNGAAR